MIVPIKPDKYIMNLNTLEKINNDDTDKLNVIITTLTCSN